MTKALTLMEQAKVEIVGSELGDLSITRDKGGVMRRFVAKIWLEQGKEVISIKGKPFITKEGQLRQQKVAQLTVLTPETVAVGDSMKSNPYPEKDPDTGHIISVHIRKIAIGPGPLGNLMASDYTLIFSPRAMHMEQLAKLNSAKAVQLGLKDEKPDMEGIWGYYPIDAVFGYWVNAANPDVQKKYETYIQVTATAERRAQGIAMRNAIANHPATQGMYAAEHRDAEGRVYYYAEVTGWKHDMDLAKIKTLQKKADEGTLGEDDGVDVRTVTEEEKDPEVIDADFEAAGFGPEELDHTPSEPTVETSKTPEKKREKVKAKTPAPEKPTAKQTQVDDDDDFFF